MRYLCKRNKKNYEKVPYTTPCAAFFAVGL